MKVIDVVYYLAVSYSGYIGVFRSNEMFSPQRDFNEGRRVDFLERKLKFLKGITVYGKAFIFCLVITFILSIVRDQIAQKESLLLIKRNDSISRKYYTDLEFLSRNNQIELTKNSKEIADYYIKVLAENFLKVDSSNNKVIAVVRDSIEKAKNIPVVKFCQIRPALVRNKMGNPNSYCIDLFICNESEFPAYSLKCEVYFLTFDNNKKNSTISNSHEPIINNGVLLPYHSIIKNKLFWVNERVEFFGFFIKGTFKNSNGKNFAIRSLTYFNVSENAPFIGDYLIEEEAIRRIRVEGFD